MSSRSSRIGGAALAAGAAALAAGCTTSHPASSSSPQGAGPGGSSLTAAKAVQLAAGHAQHVTSFAAAMTVRTTGTQDVSLSGTMQEQTQPSPLLALDFTTVSLQGQPAPGGMQEIVNSNAIYLKMPALSRMAGKPWVKIPLAEASTASGINVSQLFQQAQTDDPLVQTRMLSSSTNVRKVGTATIEGVPTTEYTGSYPISAGLARLPADVRAKLAPQLQAAGLTTETFRVWLDDQQQVRQVITSAQGTSESVASTVRVISINQPVNAPLPPASQTATVPASALHG